MKVNQPFDVDAAPLACIFVKSQIPAQVLSCEFCNFFHPATLLKALLQRRHFIVNFLNIFNLELY